MTKNSKSIFRPSGTYGTECGSASRRSPLRGSRSTGLPAPHRSKLPHRQVRQATPFPAPRGVRPVSNQTHGRVHPENLAADAPQVSFCLFTGIPGANSNASLPDINHLHALHNAFRILSRPRRFQAVRNADRIILSTICDKGHYHIYGRGRGRLDDSAGCLPVPSAQEITS